MRQQSLNWLTSQDYILLNWKNLGQKLEEWKERLLTAFPDLNAISQGRDGSSRSARAFYILVHFITILSRPSLCSNIIMRLSHGGA